MKNDYGHSDGVTHLSSEEVMLHSLIGDLPAEVKPAPVTAIDRVSKAKIRFGVAELVSLNIDNVNRWLQTVAEGERGQDGKWVVMPSPRSAIELFIELLQFSMPKMKAVALDIRDDKGNMQKLSISDLQSIVSDQ